MLPFRLVYHEGYSLDAGEHVFPWRKYRLVRQGLIAREIAQPGDFIAPAPATDDELARVHDRGWIERMSRGTLSYQEVSRLEIPYSRGMVQAFRLAAGGTLLAARLALSDGIGFNVGGGFHHAFAGHGEGFCAFNDVAVAIRCLLSEGAIERAMVVDCDVHQGNGTATLFAEDSRVFTLSIHQLNNYPAHKPPSDIDIDLEDGTGDEDYLDLLLRHYVPALVEHRPQLIVYLAGADPYYQDELGGLGLTMGGLRSRDQFVIETALRRGASVAVTLAGGYAYQVQDTVAIHINTVKTAAAALAAARSEPRT
jgi:acetoin utilization deacetylase AcuC-like enzyme